MENHDVDAHWKVNLGEMELEKKTKKRVNLNFLI